MNTEASARIFGCLGSMLQRWGSVVSVSLAGSLLIEITEIPVRSVGVCRLSLQRPLLDLLDMLDPCYKGGVL